MKGKARCWQAGRTRGQSAVEFALAFPVVVLLILGLVDLGRLMWAYQSLAHAVREGTRYAIVHGSASPQPADEVAIRNVVVQAAATLNPDQITVLVSWDPDNAPGSRVTVEAHYTFHPATTLFAQGLALDISSRSTMTIGH
ncbi:MAG: TadE/TadG family type IV pilus assembly protein [Anaerolineae bacterium]